MFLNMFVFYCLVFCVLKSVCHAHILGRLKTGEDKHIDTFLAKYQFIVINYPYLI